MLLHDRVHFNRTRTMLIMKILGDESNVEKNQLTWGNIALVQAREFHMQVLKKCFIGRK